MNLCSARMEKIPNLFDYDAPSFFDFTKDEYPSDQWFHGDDDDEEDLSSSRSSCPSPKKKQRTDVRNNNGDLPRKSPRLLAAAHSKKTHLMTTGPLKTTEELQLEEIAKKKQELAEKRKAYEAVYKKVIAKGKPVAMKSSQAPTMPQEFHFQSDQRIKKVAEATEEKTIKDFAKTLRSALPNTTKGSGACTRPKPFNLTSAKSIPNLITAEKYKSTAEQMESMKERFRSTSQNTSSSRRPQSPGLTIPKTPNLSTKGRTRSMVRLTREEEEELDYEQHKKQQFKAHPVNHKILKEAQVGVPKIPAKAPTAVKEFNLHAGTSHPVKSYEEETSEFHAHAVNRKILEGTTGIKPAEKKALTIPESPAFSLRGRLRRREPVKPQEEMRPPGPQKVFAKPPPHMGVPFKPQFEHRFTVPKPFAVEDHSKEMLKKKEEKIKKVLEEEKKAREFHASILPSDSPDQLPPKKTRPVTAVEPFRLTVDERGKKYHEDMMKHIEEEEDQARTKAQFHASSNKVIHKAPFVPEKSTKPLTEMSSFTLNSDHRAVKREEFNQQLKEHEAMIEGVKRQREERKEKEEHEAVSQLRQNMVSKATAIKKYKLLVPQPSDKPLTEAQSPFLRTKQLRSRIDSQ